MMQVGLFERPAAPVVPVPRVESAALAGCVACRWLGADGKADACRALTAAPDVVGQAVGDWIMRGEVGAVCPGRKR
jgi:hypothetical protein